MKKNILGQLNSYLIWDATSHNDMLVIKKLMRTLS